MYQYSCDQSTLDKSIKELYFPSISPFFDLFDFVFKMYLKSVVLTWWIETQKWFMRLRVSMNQCALQLYKGAAMMQIFSLLCYISV